MCALLQNREKSLYKFPLYLIDHCGYIIIEKENKIINTHGIKKFNFLNYSLSIIFIINIKINLIKYEKNIGKV